MPTLRPTHRARWLGSGRAATSSSARIAESPIPEADRRGFAGLPWWPYDPAWRFEAHLQAGPAERLTVHSGTGEAFTLVRLGAVDTPAGPLDVHWIDVYGGGLFLPFGDATNGRDTYGGGRYLLDTVKGADLGGTTTTLVLDFNFAYHPSCAYDASWSCPLAPARQPAPRPGRGRRAPLTRCPAPMGDFVAPGRAEVAQRRSGRRWGGAEGRLRTDLRPDGTLGRRRA